MLFSPCTLQSCFEVTCAPQGTDRNKNQVLLKFYYRRFSMRQCPSSIYLKKPFSGASLVAQWLRVCLPMQGTRVRALVWEDPTCRGATRPVSHNY